MSRTFRKAFRERFGLKVLSSFIAVIIVVLTVYTLFAARNEGKKAKEGLREQGEMLSGLLARGLTVGVFAENEKMLTNEAEGALGLKDVVAVSIYNTELKLLYAKDKINSPKEAFALSKDSVRDLGTGLSVGIEETYHAFEFLRPIVIRSTLKTDESLYFGGAEGGADKVIGYVRIVLSKDPYHKEITSLLVRNAVVMLVFILASIVIIYLAVKKITSPLENLTESVKALGKGLHVEQVPVETADEIGKLAAAFNEMVVARGKAQESLRLYHEQLVALSSELLTVEEQERRRIATNLHDSIGQILAVIKIKLGLLAKAQTPGKLVDELDEIRKMIDESIQCTRSLTFELSPPVLYEFGLEAALEVLAGQIGRQHAISVNVEKHGAMGELSEDVRVLLFKTVRELLMNIVKHADARTVKISIHNEPERIRIAVEDDGKGFDVERTGLHAGAGGGFGLFSIRERLRYLNGQFEVDSAPSRGTRVLITAPRKGPENK